MKPRTEKEKAQTRHWKLRTWYGLIPQQYGKLLEDQEGKCALCGKDFGAMRVVVDHCHATGKVRGLLHVACNSMIGSGNDDPAMLDKGAAYLRERTPEGAKQEDRKPHPVTFYGKQKHQKQERAVDFQMELNDLTITVQQR